MSEIEELIRLWDARDAALRALAMDRFAPPELHEKHTRANAELLAFVLEHQRADVLEETMFWSVKLDHAFTDMDEATDSIPEGEISEFCGFIQGLPFFATWRLTDGWADVLTAPTREELERKIREAGDAD